MSHPNYSAGIDFSSDFMILELAKASTVKPVKLAASDDSDFKAGEWATVMGWGGTGDYEPTSNEPKRVAVEVKSIKGCFEFVKIDSVRRRLIVGGEVLQRFTASRRTSLDFDPQFPHYAHSRPKRSSKTGSVGPG
ncbi:hypothetical protein ON010_g7299 [Phytophthora cinnamomi]|nr:hypothetical protein ON010_g7299 [Phytophthora cinnamomi]